LEFFYLLNCIIFFRLFFLFKDKPVTVKSILILTVLQVLPLTVFYVSIELIVFVILLLAANLLLYYFEKWVRVNVCRSVSFVVMILIGMVFSSKVLSLEFNEEVIEVIKNIKLLIPAFLAGVEVDYFRINLIVFGSLVLLNEINFLIRYFFEILKLYPVYERTNEPFDEKEYSTGRVIGMLERTLIYFLVLAGEITLIGFIIAAKGFTRFKELDKKDFAEYVLIGTLLSAFLAIVVSLIVKEILSL
jgi:hypothetical protein